MVSNVSVFAILCLMYCSKASSIRVHRGTSIIEETNNHTVVLKLAVNLLGDVKKTCTGTVVNSNWIISAAHCFRYNNIKSITVEHFHNGRFEAVSDVSPNKIKVHPNYAEDESYKAAKHDVAVIHFKTTLTKYIQLAEDIPKIGEKATIIGFGDIKDESGPNKGEVIIQRRNNIISTFGNVWGCHGDSGGALVVGRRLVGVVSRRKCKRKCTTYYADVYSNLKWIQYVINSHV